MPQLLMGNTDSALEMIAGVLARYEADHPGAEAAYYRQNSVSVRIRVIDPSFVGLSKGERGKKVWPYLRTLPEDVQGDLTVLLLLTPEETQTSFANLDFNQPLPSGI